MPRSVQDIDKAIQQLQAQRQKIVTKQTEMKRASETRKKTIIGGWIMANDPDQVDRIAAQLTRPQDRRAFGLDAEPPPIQ